MSITQTIRRSLDRLYLLGGIIAAGFTIAILVLIVIQMAARWSGLVFPGGSEYAGYCMAGASFFAFAYALNSGAHIRMSLLLNALGSKRFGLDVWCFVIGTMTSTYFAWYAVKGTYWSWRLHDVSQGQDATPIWIPQLSMSIGTILLAIAFWDNLINLLASKKDNIVRAAFDDTHGE